MRYTYLGDAATRAELRGMQCDPVRDRRGKCIVSTKMAAALVTDGNTFYVVPRRRLRLNSKIEDENHKEIKKIIDDFSALNSSSPEFGAFQNQIMKGLEKVAEDLIDALRMAEPQIKAIRENFLEKLPK